jgi:hypothetical protein
MASSRPAASQMTSVTSLTRGLLLLLLCALINLESVSFSAVGKS